MDPTRRWINVLTRGKKFQPLIRHPPFYSQLRLVGHRYIQSNTNNINKTSCSTNSWGKGRTKNTFDAEIISNTITWTTTHNRIKVQRNPYYLKPGGNTVETDTIRYKTQKTKTQHIPVKCLSVIEERKNLRRKGKLRSIVIWDLNIS